MSSQASPPPQLQRELGVWGATLMGLGSIIGTGVFVSIGIAAGIAGPAVLLAIAVGALIATFNALNSAQLAASHPVSGGTYEYGYQYLTPLAWVYGRVDVSTGKDGIGSNRSTRFRWLLTKLLGLTGRKLLISIALVAVLGLTLIVLSGIRRSNVANLIIVSVTLLSLGFFILAGLPIAAAAGVDNLTPFFVETGNFTSLQTVLHASALMFVAYTGYGRIATLGEEAREPRRTIPQAILMAMVLTMLLYGVVATVAVGAVGAEVLSRAAQTQAAPLEAAVLYFGVPGGSQILAIGAMTAMLGVLLNLILGLSRVLLAMGRRRDMPRVLARLNQSETTPTLAVLVVGIAIAALVLIGNVKTTWSFSAFTVLIYYAITNLAALRLPASERLYPKWLAWLGLAACLFLAFWVEQQIWLTGLALILAGLIWHFVARWVMGNG